MAASRLNGLTRRQELFALHFSEHGDPPGAAEHAGYGLARARNRASENLRNRAVSDRIKELVQLRQSAGAPTAVGYIEQIAAGDYTDARKAAVRLRAAVVMSHTAGVGPVIKTASEAVVERAAPLDAEAVAASIVQLRRLLGYPEQPVIDVSPDKD